MRTIIAGSRTVRNESATLQAIAMCGWRPSVVLCGMAKGPDEHGEAWAMRVFVHTVRVLAPRVPEPTFVCPAPPTLVCPAPAHTCVWCAPGETGPCMCRPEVPPAHVSHGKYDPYFDPVLLGLVAPLPPPPRYVPSLPAARYGDQLPAGLSVSTVLADIDFETYSEAGYVWDSATRKWGALPGAASGKKGLPIVGVAAYAEHATADVLCFAYDLKDGRGRRRWRPGQPNPQDLFDHLAAGRLVAAWNASFEARIWTMVCTPRYGWPALPFAQVRCDMAKARAHALPGSLDLSAKVLGTTRKDADGERLMKKFSMPKNPTIKSPTPRLMPADDPIEFERYCDYNETDIVAEAEAAARIPDLSATELELWQVDQAINRRGVQVDRVAMENCIAIVNAAHTKYNAELRALTGGTVDRASELEKLKGWLGGMGLHAESLDADGIEAELGALREAINGLAFVPRPPGVPVDPRFARYHMTRDPAACLRALEIREAIGSAAVKKLFALQNQMTAEGRVHDLFSYHGARTGRPTGSGPQPTNFPNSGPELIACAQCGRHHTPSATTCPWCGAPASGKREEWNPAAVEDVLEIIATRSLAMVEMFFGDAMAAVSGCLRGLFIAKPGHRLISSDYNAIEAVGLAMLAGEQWRIDVFRTHGKIYEAGAAAITGIPFSTYMNAVGYSDEQLALPEWWNLKPAVPGGKHHPTRKTVGKVSELASGYGGWIGAWKAFGADEFFSDDEIKKNIIAWRNASPAVVDLWGGQHRGLPWEADYHAELFGVEGAAILAVQNPGQECFVKMRSPIAEARHISFIMQDDVLYCKLQSGRLITYHRPRLTPSTRRDNEVSLSYEGYNTNPKSGPPGWIRIETYGPKIVENINQAETRDIHTHAMVALERRGYPIVLHVYDEVACEVPVGYGSVAELEQIMVETPAWAALWPIRAAGGWESGRYRK